MTVVLKDRTYVNKIRREHGQMLVEKVDASRVDSLGNILADLVRASSVDHVESSPSVLGLGTCRGADEEGVLHLALEVVLLNVVGHGSWDLPVGESARFLLRQARVMRSNCVIIAGGETASPNCPTFKLSCSNDHDKLTLGIRQR